MPGLLTQCGGWHSDEVRTRDSVLVQLGQERNRLNGFTQTLGGWRWKGGRQISDLVTL